MYNNVHSNTANNNEQLERRNPSTTSEKYITVCPYNGILYHNTDESQEKMLMVRSKSHWKNAHSRILLLPIFLKRQNNYLLFRMASQERVPLGGAVIREKHKELWGADNIVFLVLVANYTVVCLIIILLSIHMGFMHYPVSIRYLKIKKGRKKSKYGRINSRKQKLYLHNLKQNHQLRAAPSLTHLVFLNKCMNN